MRGLGAGGQARIMEAIAATLIILILALLMPILFKSPSTTLQSEIQVGEEEYAYNVLYDVYANPQFLSYISQGNWSALKSLMDLTVGPQYNWFLCIEPLGKALRLSSAVNQSYVVIPLQVVQVPFSPYAKLTLNLRILNWLLPPGYSINTTWPLSNVFFTTPNGQPIYWWVERYDPTTGNAVVWLSTSSPVVWIYVSRNGTYPYDPINNTYCTTPYCPPYGGLSMFEVASLGTPGTLNNGPYVFVSNYSAQYYGFTEQNTECNNAVPSTPLVLSTGSNSLASCTVSNPVSASALEVDYLSMFVSAIPDSTLTMGFTAVIKVINTVSGGVIYSTQVPITVSYTYGENGETVSLTVGSNTSKINETSYTYISSSRIIVAPTMESCPGGLNVVVDVSLLVHDYLSDNYIRLVNNFTTQCIQAQLSPSSWPNVVVEINGLSIAQSSPNDPQYLYNTTNVIYDLWIVPEPTTTYVNPVSISYSCIDNVVPRQYAYRFVGIPFTPTAEAYTIVQLQNGSYYLVMMSLQRLGGG